MNCKIYFHSFETIAFGIVILSLQMISSTTRLMAEPDESIVTKVEIYDGDSNAKLDVLCKLYIENLNLLLEKAPGSNSQLILFIDDLPMVGVNPISIDTSKSTVLFMLCRDTSSIRSWSQFFKFAKGFQKDVKLTVGYYNSFTIDTKAGYTKFIIVRKLQFYISLSLVLLLVVILIILGKRSNIIRDTSTNENKPYSLARTQLAFWMILITFSFVFIWAVTGSLPIVTGTILTLLGISIATTAGAKVIDFSQAGFDRFQNKPSRGFFLDLLSDEKGVNIHRFQLVVWTILLGFFFVRNVVINLDMPQFDDNLLILMGISNGTYVGLKVQENSKKEIATDKQTSS